MLSMLYVRLMIKVKVGIPESFKVGWYPHKITGSSHLKPLQIGEIMSNNRITQFSYFYWDTNEKKADEKNDLISRWNLP